VHDCPLTQNGVVGPRKTLPSKRPEVSCRMARAAARAQERDGGQRSQSSHSRIVEKEEGRPKAALFSP